MLRYIIALAVIALSVATPVDNKDSLKSSVPEASTYSQPNISTLPVKLGADAKYDSAVKLDQVISNSHGLDPHSHHKRDAPKVADAQTSNNQHPAVSSTQKKHSVDAPLSSSKTTDTPKTPAQQTQSSRNRRDVPKVAVQKQSNTQSTPTQKSESTPQPSTNQRKTPTNNLKAQSANQKPSIPNTQSGQAPRPSTQTSQNNQAIKTPSESLRSRRDAPKVADQKTGNVQPAITQKSQVAPQANQNQRQTASDNLRQQSVNKRPVVPDTQKASQQDTLKAPSSVAPETGRIPLISTNGRNKRDAPTNSRPISSIKSTELKSSQIPTEVANDSQKPVKSSSDGVRTTGGSSPLPQHKRETPSAVPHSSSDNQSPSYVRPVPVDQVLHKQSNIPQADIVKTGETTTITATTAAKST